MTRPFLRRWLILSTLLAAALLPSLGCRTGLMTVMYLLKGTDVDPDFAGLKGKKVAVVCRPMVSLQYRNINVSNDLALEITRLLKEKVPKIEVVEQRKVAKWVDENSWDEYAEVGRGVKADIVVGVDLEQFSIYQGQTLYQGKANATLRVYDCQQKGKLVFEKIVPPSIYPPSGGVSTSDRAEAEFRREFVAVLADQIARHFYSHDPHADLALDAAALK
ncbi:MAG: hypothetical protein ABFC77_16060 [Thermoguttaceae bacterium]